MNGPSVDERAATANGSIKSANAKKGSLVVVGTGLQIGHITLEARAHIESADKLLCVVPDTVTWDWLLKINPSAESLRHYYAEGKNRLITYNEMVERILGCVRQSQDVCAAFYGHPGVFVYPSHAAIYKARAEGYQAKMLPGVSAESCLYADLGVDPGLFGSQNFEATDFILRNRIFDPFSALIIWQLGSVGNFKYSAIGRYQVKGFNRVIKRLLEQYPSNHEVIIYEAATLPTCDATINQVPISELSSDLVTARSTLYVPPKGRKQSDEALVRELELPETLRKRPDVSIYED
jgi:uncharacterized protein YabN with tetrapyrrole methylase and pyrophosphatase domain